VVLSNLYPSSGPQAIGVDLVNLSTGKISGQVSGQVATPYAIGGSLAVDPQSGLIYLFYSSTVTGNHLQVINPASLTVILDVQTAATGSESYRMARESTALLAMGLARLQAKTLSPAGSLAISGGAGGLALSPDGSVLYAGYPIATSENVDLVDTTTLQVTRSVY